MTYESFYGLSEKPFTLSTDPKFIYHSTAHDRVVKELVDAIGRREGMMVLTGELGTGRTTLCRSLVEQLGRRMMICFVREPVASFEELLKVALTHFGVFARDEATRARVAVATRQELIAAAGDFAASLAASERSALIVVDDAHNAPADVLEPLAALTAPGDRLVQVLLVGAPALTSRLQTDIQPLHRAVTVWSRLDPLSADETASYVAHRLALAGVKPRVEFDAKAYAELHAVTGGMPRLINLVCDRALALGFAAQTAVIDDALIAAAASDLALVAPETETWSVLRKAVVMLVVLASLLAGAAAAAWVFRADLSRLMELWRG